MTLTYISSSKNKGVRRATTLSVPVAPGSAIAAFRRRSTWKPAFTRSSLRLKPREMAMLLRCKMW